MFTHNTEEEISVSHTNLLMQSIRKESKDVVKDVLNRIKQTYINKQLFQSATTL